jgi:hypothetical protein
VDGRPTGRRQIIKGGTKILQGARVPLREGNDSLEAGQHAGDRHCVSLRGITMPCTTLIVTTPQGITP